jgi:hypothetical protein
MKKVFIISIIGLFAFAGCKKYDDGPAFSLASKKARVVNVWKLDKQFINGAEQTLTADDKDDYMEFKKDGSYSYTSVNGSISTTSTGTWAFDSKKENILVSFTYGSITSTTTSKILRLKSNELWLESKSGNDTEKDYYISK